MSGFSSDCGFVEGYTLEEDRLVWIGDIMYRIRSGTLVPDHMMSGCPSGTSLFSFGPNTTPACSTLRARDLNSVVVHGIKYQMAVPAEGSFAKKSVLVPVIS
jgi:hypothetical protein